MMQGDSNKILRQVMARERKRERKAQRYAARIKLALVIAYMEEVERIAKALNESEHCRPQQNARARA